jgi:ABC-type phosphate/phosphonate transport system substrate-binding protein/rhodanese-related sulfurtransferase
MNHLPMIRTAVFLISGLAIGMVVLAAPVAAKQTIGVTSETTEYAGAGKAIENFHPLGQYLSQVLGQDVTVVFSQDLTRDLQRTRTGDYSIIIAPAHLVGSALRYGYEPVAKLPASERAAFITLKSSGIASLEQARGKRLGLPHDDSLATYLALGEINAKNLPLKKYFRSVQSTRYHESALEGLSLGMYDLIAVDARFGRSWLANHPGNLIFESREVPAMSIAVSKRLGADLVAQVKKAFLAPNSKLVSGVQIAGFEFARLQRATDDDFTYVSTLGYFTPTLLPGAKVVTAEEVAALMQNKAIFFDVRTNEEYSKSRVKGAKLLPYKEVSKKEVDFDPSKDEFKLADANVDRNTPLVFACNGAECWKSYKAAKFAVAAGYKNVHWFRGGFPEWRAKNMPLEP